MNSAKNPATIVPRAMPDATMEILERYAERAGYGSPSEILAGRTREPALENWSPWWARS